MSAYTRIPAPHTFPAEAYFGVHEITSTNYPQYMKWIEFRIDLLEEKKRLSSAWCCCLNSTRLKDYESILPITEEENDAYLKCKTLFVDELDEAEEFLLNIKVGDTILVNGSDDFYISDIFENSERSEFALTQSGLDVVCNEKPGPSFTQYNIAQRSSKMKIGYIHTTQRGVLFLVGVFLVDMNKVVYCLHYSTETHTYDHLGTKPICAGDPPILHLTYEETGV